MTLEPLWSTIEPEFILIFEIESESQNKEMGKLPKIFSCINLLFRLNVSLYFFTRILIKTKLCSLALKNAILGDQLLNETVTQCMNFTYRGCVLCKNASSFRPHFQ